MELIIKKMGINGEGIGYDQGKPVFVSGALPQEHIECQIVENYPRYCVAKMTRLISPSKDRIRPACSHQKLCGGCPLMILPYARQLEYKKELLREALQKYAGKNIRIEAVIPSKAVLNYRNQCKLPVKKWNGKLQCGLYSAQSNRLIAQSSCVVHETALEKVRQQIMHILNEEQLNEYDPKRRQGIRGLAIRTLGKKHQAVLVSGEEAIPDNVIQKIMALPGMVSLMQNQNTSTKTVPFFSQQWRLLAGSKSLVLEHAEWKLKLSPQAFFQLNTDQAFVLYQTVKQLIPACDLLVEAYCGIGTMSLMLAQRAKEVIGIEIVPGAIHNAKENARLNHLDHVHFLVGDAAEKMKQIAKKRTIDVLLIDPPRSGMAPAMLECILKAKPKTIVYVSCNPATLAKNLAELSGLYQLERVLPLDMFPNTPLVETIALLTLIHQKGR